MAAWWDECAGEALWHPHPPVHLLPGLEHSAASVKTQPSEAHRLQAGVVTSSMLKVVWLWIVTRTERSEAAARTSASAALSWALAALPCGTHARDHCRRRQKSVRLARGFFSI